MKGLASVLLVALMWSAASAAGSLQMSVGAGPSATSLDAINNAIGVFNALIVHLNETFDVHPNVEGAVGTIGTIGSGLSFHASERYWVTDWLGLGGRIGYLGASTGVRGEYRGSEVSQIDVSLGLRTVSGILCASTVFLDVGLQLGAEIGVGYYHTTVDRSVVFEIPSEYPQAISGVPPQGSGRYSGGTVGFEAGFSLTYPLFPSFALGTTVSYRSARIATVRNAEGTGLDLDGDGRTESIDLNGITVQLTLSLSIDLSLDGRKE